MGRVAKIIDINTLREKYSEIGNVKELAKFFHTSNSRMLKLLHDNGIKTKNVGNRIVLKKSFVRKIINDYTKYNLTMKEISEKYELTIDKIRDIFRENGVSAYKWHGHTKKVHFRKTDFIKQIKAFFDENGIEYTVNYKVKAKCSVTLMANGICVDVYHNKNLVDYSGCKYRQILNRKRDICTQAGYKYIQIFEDEYKDKQEVVLSKLRYIFGRGAIYGKIPARKCDVLEITSTDAEKFLNANHIQGFVGSTKHLAAFYKGMIVAVMSFTDEKYGAWNLTRFATLNGYICQGIGGKLFKSFVDRFKPLAVRSFADRRWTINSTDNLYTKLGFKYEYTTSPGYYYANGDSYKRIRREKFKKDKLIKKYGLQDGMTEMEMANELGYGRIWDCGLFKYVWRKDNGEQ